jgi:MarC family membrane protein
MWIIFSVAFPLFLLMDPIGNVPLFISLLKRYNPAKQRKIILRELFIALLVIISFNFVGDGILALLAVEQYTTMIAGGIILFLIALKMIFPNSHDHDGDLAYQKEPYIVPLAIPLVAGPAVLAAVMLFAHDHPISITVPAIIIAWLASVIILLASSFLKHLLGWRGISACERLMGLILTLIAVEMFLKGLTLYRATVT